MTGLDPDPRLRRTDRVAGEGGDGLAAWAAQLTADEAVRARSRERWLARQAAEEGTFAGVLTDLSERGRTVVVHLHSGRLHRGVVTVVGRDFAVVRTGAGRDVTIALSAVASVRTLPREPATLGDRAVQVTTSLGEMLSWLVDERVRVAIVGLDARQLVSGELRSVGRDVVTVRLDGDGGTAYVTLDSVAEMSLVESG